MRHSDLIKQFSTSRENQMKAIFSSLFILQNQLQTIFDHQTKLTLKQFMLLTMVRQSQQHLTFTQLGRLLGCSRQNIKKLASVLRQKGFVQIQPSSQDARALVIVPTEKLGCYFKEAEDFHRKKLSCLFQEYSDEEVGQFFRLFMKLYHGVERLEEDIT